VKTPGFLRVTAACLLVACSEKPPIGPPNPTTLTFSTVAAGFATSCALTTDSAAYCWGYDINGTLGTGPSTGASKSNPVKVLGGLAFSDLSVGYGHSCGVVRGGAAYCWGVNDDGALGDGTTEFRYTPTAVTGSLVFTSISTGYGHSCGITTDQAAYCWGHASSLGSGSWDLQDPHPNPVVVTGGLHFAMVSVGIGDACGVTTDSVAYCWGDGTYGQLGDGVSIPRDGGHASASPVPVVGGLKFATVSAADFACGITTAGAAYCWGPNIYGELGNGSGGPEACTTYPCSTTPLAVLGGLTFATVSVGGEWRDTYACGVATSGAAYCWGGNDYGQLGDGTTTVRSSPVAVLGGHKFVMVSAAMDGSGIYSHTCGITTQGETYCWGSNNKGQLGDGTTNNSSVPVKVVVQQ